MKSNNLINSNIALFYDKVSEETRLDKGMGVFEFERIKFLINKYIEKPQSKIIDVGGGTGKYAAWLALKGHTVHLIDPIPKHIKIANIRSSKQKNKFSVSLGEAKNLDFPNNYADLVILHGPLYHLQSREDRNRAILEAKRVVKKKGIILGFAINYTASTLAGLLNGLFIKKPFFTMCIEELTTGMHNPPSEYPWLLADAYYHSPAQLKEEFLYQNLQYINTYAIEGMIWLEKEFFASIHDPERKEMLMHLLKITENDPNLLSFSPHMMLVAKKI